MIVSASYRTDIPACCAEWFEERFRDGRCLVRSPYGGRPYEVSLKSGVDGYVFWTRNIQPFQNALSLVVRAHIPFMVQYSLTGYPKELERATPDPDHAISRLGELSAAFGERCAVWRYDPVIFTNLTPPEWHLANFAALASRLEGVVDEVVVSFLHPYVKTTRAMQKEGRQSGLSWRLPDPDEKAALLENFGECAAQRGMVLSLCAQPDLRSGAKAAACVDPARLSDIAGHPVLARRKGNRDGCLCAESRDIGAYGSCRQGCVYCYAR